MQSKHADKRKSSVPAVVTHPSAYAVVEDRGLRVRGGLTIEKSWRLSSLQFYSCFLGFACVLSDSVSPYVDLLGAWTIWVGDDRHSERLSPGT